VVVVERSFRHPRYARVIKRTMRFKAHDERNEAHVGDRVLIVETRPLSKDKRWRIKEILERAS
jgi:small subunit ribosomal protein S17